MTPKYSQHATDGNGGPPLLPHGWRRAPLREVCSIIAGQSPPGETYRKSPEGLPFFQGKADFGVRHPVARTWCVAPNKIASVGDILISVRAPVGPTNVADVECCIGRGLAAIRPREGLADRDFILSALKLYESDLAQLGSGSTFQAINREVLEALPIPFPPLPEQRRIAARLQELMFAVAEARAAVQAQFDAAQNLPVAHLRAVFNSSAASRWPKRRIGEVAKIQSGYAFKSEWFTGDGIRLLRNANVSQDRIDWTETARLPATRRAEFPTYELSEGDIILSLDRPVVSGGLKVARVSGGDLPALLLQRVGRFQLKEGIQADYLYHFLHTQDFISEITAHDQSLGVPHVSPKQVEHVQFPAPPIAEQRTVAARIETELGEARALVAHLSARLTALDHLPAALLREAFRGRL